MIDFSFVKYDMNFNDFIVKAKNTINNIIFKKV